MCAAPRIADCFGDGLAALGLQESERLRIGEPIHRYLALLAKWNKVYNLTAITDPQQMITHHALDSLAVAAPIATCVMSVDQPRVLDVGSGAGLPGIPLAIAHPDWQLTLLDGNSKKTVFITQAVAELGLKNVKVVTGRAESYAGPQFDVIVSRAFSSLGDFVTCTRQLLRDGGCWAAMKGVVPEDELRDLPPDIAPADVVRLQVPGLDAERHVLLLKVKTG